jgi:uncharacterized membrane protein YbhN (UPF0104 family)
VKIIKLIIQYLLPLLLAGLLLSYAYGDFHLDTLLTQLSQVKTSWILLSVGLSLASHLVRAYRWKLLLQPLNFYPSLVQTSIALLIGYASNLFIPRLGELVRCTILKRHINIPTSTSLGTVVGERTIDLLSFLVVLSFALTITFQQLRVMLYDTVLTRIGPQTLHVLGWTGFILIVIVGLLIGVLRSNRFNQKPSWLLKLEDFSQGIWQGITSIGLSNQKVAILFSTVLMWLLYYLAGYVGAFAISGTSGLGLSAGLAILAMSSISLTLPVQGGIGAYHLLVSSTLMAYGVSKDHAMLYVTVMHTSQLLMTLLAAGASLIAELFYPKKP